jgi:hypothetical protein
MELIKKAPAQKLDLVLTNNSKSVSFEKKGIVVASTNTTHKTVDGVKTQQKHQTCFNLHVSKNANHEIVNAFLQ